MKAVASSVQSVVERKKFRAWVRSSILMKSNSYLHSRSNVTFCAASHRAIAYPPASWRGEWHKNKRRRSEAQQTKQHLALPSPTTTFRMESPAGGDWVEFKPTEQRYWEMRHLLWSRYDEGIRMDEEGWYSVTAV